MSSDSLTRRCFNCNKPGHLARDCRALRKESSGHNGDKRNKTAGAKHVQASDPDKGECGYNVEAKSKMIEEETAILALLFSSDRMMVMESDRYVSTIKVRSHP